MEFNYHNCGSGNAPLQRAVQEVLDQPAPRGRVDAVGAGLGPHGITAIQSRRIGAGPVLKHTA
jgi:hypothetical protein